MASTKTGLLNFVVIGVLLAVIGTTYVFYATPIIDEAEKVNKENAVAQFQRVVMLARAQWIKTKQDTVLIYETEFDAGGKVKQRKDVAAELYINEKGWPEGLEKEQGNGHGSRWQEWTRLQARKRGDAEQCDGRPESRWSAWDSAQVRQRGDEEQ